MKEESCQRFLFNSRLAASLPMHACPHNTLDESSVLKDPPKRPRYNPSFQLLTLKNFTYASPAETYLCSPSAEMEVPFHGEVVRTVVYKTRCSSRVVQLVQIHTGAVSGSLF